MCLFSKKKRRDEAGAAEEVNEVKIPISDLKLEKPLGNGRYGAVNLASNPAGELVVIKMCTNAPTPRQRARIVEEVKLMTRIPVHHYVVQITGYSFQPNEPHLVFEEYMSRGSLGLYLQEVSELFERDQDFCLRKLATVMTHIAGGMNFLSSQNIFHTRLTSKNILVSREGSGVTCKVSGFGFVHATETSKDTLADIMRERNHNWRWMPPEVLADGGRFVLGSDVWSYGIVLWEVFSFMQTPYTSQSLEEVQRILANGTRLPCPKHCLKLEGFKQLMESCWHPQSDARPAYEHILTQLGKVRKWD